MFLFSILIAFETFKEEERSFDLQLTSRVQSESFQEAFYRLLWNRHFMSI